MFIVCKSGGMSVCVVFQEDFRRGTQTIALKWVWQECRLWKKMSIFATSVIDSLKFYWSLHFFSCSAHTQKMFKVYLNVVSPTTETLKPSSMKKIENFCFQSDILSFNNERTYYQIKHCHCWGCSCFLVEVSAVCRYRMNFRSKSMNATQGKIEMSSLSESAWSSVFCNQLLFSIGIISFILVSLRLQPT